MDRGGDRLERGERIKAPLRPSHSSTARVCDNKTVCARNYPMHVSLLYCLCYCHIVNTQHHPLVEPFVLGYLIRFEHELLFWKSSRFPREDAVFKTIEKYQIQTQKVSDDENWQWKPSMEKGGERQRGVGQRNEHNFF